MRVLFGMVVLLLVLLVAAILQPDGLARLIYQVHDISQSGKTTSTVKWVKVEVPKNTP